MAITRGKIAPFLGNITATLFWERLQKRATEYDKWINVEKSQNAYEEDTALAGLGPMVRKAEGGVYTYDEPIIGNTVRYSHQTFGLAFRVTEEVIEDEKWGIVKKLVDELAKSAWANKEVNAHAVLNRGFDPAYQGFDGQPLFSTAHPRMDGAGNQANRLAVEADLSQTSLQAAIEMFETMTDDRGIPLNVAPKFLIVGPANIWVANEILGSSQDPDSNRNAINVISSKYGIAPIISHWLTDPDSWFLLGDKGEHDLKMYIRVDDQFKDYEDEATGDVINSVRHRLVSGFSDWRGTFGSQGA